jgi:hypothetical protein
MKNAKKSDRITSELLETALALSKHNVLSAQELNQINALRTTPPVYTAKKVALIRTRKPNMN